MNPDELRVHISRVECLSTKQQCWNLRCVAGFKTGTTREASTLKEGLAISPARMEEVMILDEALDRL